MSVIGLACQGWAEIRSKPLKYTVPTMTKKLITPHVDNHKISPRPRRPGRDPERPSRGKAHGASERSDRERTDGDADSEATRRSTRAPEGSMERAIEDELKGDDDRSGDRDDPSFLRSAAHGGGPAGDRRENARSGGDTQVDTSQTHEREHAPRSAHGRIPDRTMAAQKPAMRPRPEKTGRIQAGRMKKRKKT